MTKRKSRADEGEKPPQIVRVEIPVLGEKEPVVLEEPAPKGFPPNLLRYLAEYLERGFRAGHAHKAQEMPDIDELAFEPTKQRRPPDPRVDEQGRLGAKLRRQGLTYGEIAVRLCERRGKPGHRCGKRCSDRIRQAIKTRERQEEV